MLGRAHFSNRDDYPTEARVRILLFVFVPADRPTPIITCQAGIQFESLTPAREWLKSCILRGRFSRASRFRLFSSSFRPSSDSDSRAQDSKRPPLTWLVIVQTPYDRAPKLGCQERQVQH